MYRFLVDLWSRWSKVMIGCQRPTHNLRKTYENQLEKPTGTGMVKFFVIFEISSICQM